jgi:hypothetical protein
MGHVVTPKPSPGGWRALCLRAHGGARALWHQERIWNRGADLFKSSAQGYPVCRVLTATPEPTSGEVTNPQVGPIHFPYAVLMIFVLDDFEVIAWVHHWACVIFDRSRRRRGARRGYRNVSLGVPQATVCYCVTGYAGGRGNHGSGSQNDVTLRTTVMGCAGRYTSSCRFHRSCGIIIN